MFFCTQGWRPTFVAGVGGALFFTGLEGGVEGTPSPFFLGVEKLGVGVFAGVFAGVFGILTVSCESETCVSCLDWLLFACCF